MSNNQAEDRYNPPSATSIDFDEMRFRDVPVEELFWPTNQNSKANTCHQKIDENSGMNTKTREIVKISLDVKVYQKI